jgi:hypothetical protein
MFGRLIRAVRARLSARCLYVCRCAEAPLRTHRHLRQSRRPPVTGRGDNCFVWLVSEIATTTRLALQDYPAVALWRGAGHSRQCRRGTRRHRARPRNRPDPQGGAMQRSRAQPQNIAPTLCHTHNFMHMAIDWHMGGPPSSQQQLPC